MRAKSRRSKRAAICWAAVLVLAVIGGLVQPTITAGAAGAAGAGQYSAPEWWPLRGTRLVGCARNSPGAVCGGNYHPVWAIDIQAPEGTPIYASGAGLATVYSDTTACTGYGRAVSVNHNGQRSLYGHMSSFSSALAASPGGVWVDQNTVIGYVGHTGNVSNCSYNHLHYEESTSGSWWTGASDPGSFKACQGSALVTYPQAWGASSWNGLAAHTYSATSDGTGCAAAGDDDDGDGVADAADSCRGLPGSGDYAGCPAPEPLAADVNGDGRGDLVHVHPGSAALNVWLSNGDGHFSIVANPTGDYDVTSGRWLVGDVTGDGRADLVHVHAGSHNVNIWVSNGDGHFTVVANTMGGYDLTSGSWFVTDVDDDRRVDLVHIHPGSSNVNVWRSNGDGHFTIVATPAGGYDLASGRWLVADTTGDGRGDLVHIHPGSHNVNVWVSTGGGHLAIHQTPAGGYDLASGRWLIADVTGDRRADLVHLHPGSQSVNVWLGATSGGFAVVQTDAGGYDLANGTWLSADVTGDRRLDLVHVHPGSHNVNVWVANGDGHFTITANPTGGYDLTSGRWMVDEASADGRADLVHLHAGSASANVWLSSGNGRFGVVQTATGGYDLGGGTWMAGVDPVVPLCGPQRHGPFPDVAGGHPFCSDIDWMARRGLTSGYGDGTFRPTVAVSRQAVASFLWSLAGKPAVPAGAPHFADVLPGSTFFSAIEWMAEQGFATGTLQPNGSRLFLPASPVSRQAMASFLFRFAGSPTYPTEAQHFADVAPGSTFYAAVQWMAHASLASGTPHAPGLPLFKPADPVSRQAAAAFLHRYAVG